MVALNACVIFSISPNQSGSGFFLSPAVTVNLIFIKCDASSVLNTFSYGHCFAFRLPFIRFFFFVIVLFFYIFLFIYNRRRWFDNNFDALPQKLRNKRARGMGAVYNIEDHLKMDNGENIYRNPNEFNFKRIGLHHVRSQHTLAPNISFEIQVMTTTATTVATTVKHQKQHQQKQQRRPMRIFDV